MPGQSNYDMAVFQLIIACEILFHPEFYQNYVNYISYRTRIMLDSLVDSLMSLSKMLVDIKNSESFEYEDVTYTDEQVQSLLNISSFSEITDDMSRHLTSTTSIVNYFESCVSGLASEIAAKIADLTVATTIVRDAAINLNPAITSTDDVLNISKKVVLKGLLGSINSATAPAKAILVELALSVMQQKIELGNPGNGYAALAAVSCSMLECLKVVKSLSKLNGVGSLTDMQAVKAQLMEYLVAIQELVSKLLQASRELSGIETDNKVTTFSSDIRDNSNAMISGAYESGDLLGLLSNSNSTTEGLVSAAMLSSPDSGLHAKRSIMLSSLMETKMQWDILKSAINRDVSVEYAEQLRVIQEQILNETLGNKVTPDQAIAMVDGLLATSEDIDSKDILLRIKNCLTISKFSSRPNELASDIMNDILAVLLV
jgi:hypothetical protein